jgi:hypothetical protein
MSYMSEKECILDWVERGCRRLMKAGGGALSQGGGTWNTRRPRTSPEDIGRIVGLAQHGAMTATQIANALGLNARQVRHITYYRDIKLPDERMRKQRDKAA